MDQESNRCFAFDWILPQTFCYRYTVRRGSIVMGSISSVASFCLALAHYSFLDEAIKIDGKKIDGKTTQTVVENSIWILVGFLIIRAILDMVFVISVIKGYRSIIPNFCCCCVTATLVFIVAVVNIIFLIKPLQAAADVTFVAITIYYGALIKSYMIHHGNDPDPPEEIEMG